MKRELRIKSLEMTEISVVMALAGGNPGALIAGMEMLKHSERIDPDALMGGLGGLFMLDTLGVYDDRLYMLWSDVCERDMSKTLAALRAYQLGQLAGVTEMALNHAIDNRGAGLDLDAIMKAVMERLPRFNQVPAEVAP